MAVEKLDTSAIGRRIRAAREAMGVSQTALADSIGIRPHDLWRHESGRILPGPGRLEVIALKLNVSTAWLLWGKETDAPQVVRDDVVYPAVRAYVDAERSAGRPLHPDDEAELLGMRLKGGGVGLTHEDVADYHRATTRRRLRHELEGPSAAPAVPEGRKRVGPPRKR